MEESGGPQSMGSPRVGHDWATHFKYIFEAEILYNIRIHGRSLDWLLRCALYHFFPSLECCLCASLFWVIFFNINSTWAALQGLWKYTYIENKLPPQFPSLRLCKYWQCQPCKSLYTCKHSINTWIDTWDVIWRQLKRAVLENSEEERFVCSPDF